ncbi:MAG: ABC transporter substrate-binding protein [Acidimicrobiia bacterium]
MRRQRFVAGVTALVVLAIAAAACTSTPAPTTTTTVPTTTTMAPTTTVAPTTTTEPLPTHPTGGEVVIAVDDEPPTLNPFLPGGDKVVGALLSQAYAAGIYDVDADTLSYVPELITEVPTVDNGGVVLNADGTMTVRYTIRDEAQWDDGTPVSGYDFKFTLDTILNPDYPISKANYQDIISITAGDKTFEFTMARPTLQHELMFGQIIPKHIVEGTDFLTDWNDKRWASAGPFVLESWTKGSSIRLVRNENYWKTDPETSQQLPYLDAVTFVFEDDTPAMIESFAQREHDVFSPDPTIANIQTLQGLEPQGADIQVVAGPVWEHLNFQFGPGRFNRNENSCNEVYEMRLAVAQTVDRDLLTTDILGGEVPPLQSYIDAYAPEASQEAWAQYSVDHDAAAANYAAAVAATGRECKVIFSTNTLNDERDRMSVMFSEMFAAVGIPYDNELENSLLYYGDTLATGGWDMGEWTWQGSPGLSGLVGIHDVFDPDSPPPFGSNFYRWGTEDSSIIDETTARFAELRDLMNATVDSSEILEYIAEAENILADNLVIIPLYQQPVSLAVWEDEIVGVRHNPTRAGFTWNIEFWHRAE